MTPAVTIVIPFYNCPYIQYALDSAVGQAYPNVEIIVVDDGSSRYTELIQPYLNRVYYLGKANGGTASALNHGIRHASGEYIAWLSSDDLFYPHKLERQVRFMLQHDLEASYTAFANINASHHITAPFNGLPMASQADLCRQLIYCNPINGCTLVARKEAMLRSGLFNEQLLYTHDYDMWARMLMNRVRFGYLPEVLTQYRVHSNMGTIRYQKAIEEEYSQVKRYYKSILQKLALQYGG